jgi:hypothetical protein
MHVYTHQVSYLQNKDGFDLLQISEIVIICLDLERDTEDQ